MPSFRRATVAALTLAAGCGVPPERLEFDASAVLKARAERIAADANRSDGARALDIDRVREVALAQHPALQLAGRRARAPKVEAEHLRRFQGPVLGLDLERIVSGASDPFEWVAMLGFELPLGGALEARRRALAAESALLAAEASELAYEHLREVDEQFVLACRAELRREAVAGHVAELERLLETVELSESAGVLETLDGDLVRFAHVSAQLAASAASSERTLALTELRRLMGVADDDDAEIALLGREALLANLERDVPTESELAWQEDPGVAVAAARLALAEETLQYVWREGGGALALAAGPGGKDGEDLIALGAEVPLARSGSGRLARARVERDLAGEALAVAVEGRADTVARSLDGAAAAKARRSAVADRLLPLADRQLAQLESLRDLGDLRVLVVLEALEGHLDAELEHLEHALDELRARLVLEALASPAPEIPLASETRSASSHEERPR